MNKIKNMLCAIMCGALIVPSASAFAQEEATLTAAAMNQGFSIRGSLPVNEETVYIVKILTEDYVSPLSDENISEYLVSIYQGTTDETGNFSIEVPLSASVLSGTYNIMLTAAGSESVDKSFMCYYVSGAERDEIIASINDAKGSGELRKYAESNAVKLNLPVDDMYSVLSDKSHVYEVMFKRKSKEQFDTPTQIQESFIEGCIIQYIYEAPSDADVIRRIGENNSVLKLDMTDANLISDMGDIGKLIAGEKFYSVDDLASAFYEAVAACEFNQATRSEMSDLTEKYRTNLEPYADFKTYDKAGSSKKLELYKYMENKTDFTSFSDIGEYIDDCLDDISKKADSSGGGKGGGGVGSSSGGVGSIVVAGGNTDAITQTAGDSSSSITPGAKFTDLDCVEWAVSAIEYLANEKIVNGESETVFAPNRAVTREEFVKIIVEAFDFEKNTGVTGFADVDSGEWYAPYIASAVENNIITGISKTAFGIGQPVSRQDMATILYRVIKQKDITLNSSADMPGFSDFGSVSEYAAEAVEYLCRSGIMNGVSQTEFDPCAEATRAMAAKVVYMLIAQ